MNNKVTLVPSESQMKQRAREHAKQVLTPMSVFHAMTIDDQRKTYDLLVQEHIDKQMQDHGLARPMATDSGAEMGYKGYDPGFSGDTKSFKELVDSVDFPKFVADLLKAVFDANLKVMKQQTDSYIKLMKEATKSTADFIKKVKDDDAFAKLAESRSDKYNVITVSFNAEMDALWYSASLNVQNTNIQVNTSDKKATDDLSATLHGKVNIEFKTDYFKLDNFANMYADGGVAALKPAGAGAPGAPGQVAAAPRP